MANIPKDYLPRLYAGWLGKIIGIRLGAPVEGWTYQQILDKYGESPEGYLVDYREFAADDDSNGPLFYLRALMDKAPDAPMTPQDVGNALLNYAPYEHGFFWWGGYGTSTEHTAYLNLSHGIPAPRSGSTLQNGAAVAEQIGGQIFIDTWGLVAPGNPDLAAELARKAASVTHDGEGIHGGVFIAVCIALAFVETEIPVIIEKALAYLPGDSEYVRVCRAVMDFHGEHPEDWRACFRYIFENFGYDRYPGVCHIIPNSAVILLSLLYGAGDFDRTLTLCNLCGWDTDCNVGNVGTILGVLVGLPGIDEERWIRPVHDLLICSSVVGSLNIMDLPYGASFIAHLAYQLAGETPEPLWREIFEKRIDSCHFEYPGSTHSLYARLEPESAAPPRLTNSGEMARTGARSLKVELDTLEAGQQAYVFKQTYYVPADFHDSRYDPSFSPLLYPGQRVHVSVGLPQGGDPLVACVYVKDRRTGDVLRGGMASLRPGHWQDLSYQIPALEGALIAEAGVCLSRVEGTGPVACYLDDLYFSGAADYTIDFGREEVEHWTLFHREISQFTRFKGLTHLEGGALSLGGTDRAEVYTGRHDWGDLDAEFWVRPELGEGHFALVRVQGAARAYAVGFDGQGRLSIQKNHWGYRPLASVPFAWRPGETYRIRVSLHGGRITVRCGEVALSFVDTDAPYLWGGIGLAAHGESRLVCEKIRVAPAQEKE